MFLISVSVPFISYYRLGYDYKGINAVRYVPLVIELIIQELVLKNLCIDLVLSVIAIALPITLLIGSVFAIYL